MGSHSHGLNPTQADTDIATQSHYNLLGSVLGGSDKAQEAIIYSYNKHINGFAAVLSEEEAERIKNLPNVVSVFENNKVQLHTTRTWEFLGLEQDGVATSQSLWKKSNYGKDTIIATLDTGFWPESESFSDKGLGPVPSRWKGECADKHIKCNKKVIGARYFNKGFEQAVGGNLSSIYHTVRDTEGHGSHTLSTAGGSFVPKASIFGNANGTAKGGSPQARVAAYKVCWPELNNIECVIADILAGFEAAIADGVDVLSVSLGGSAVDYKEDGLAIGAFHAVQHGITVVASAGNSGPTQSTVSNVAPWLLTVAASSLDRGYGNVVSFGGRHFEGKSLGGKILPKRQFYPVINSSSAQSDNASVTFEDATLCKPGSLDSSKVKGKIVVCLRGTYDRIEKGLVVKKAGGVGYVLADDLEHKNAPLEETDLDFLPASHISYKDGQTLFNYIKFTRKPYAYITNVKTYVGSKRRAPVMAYFSSVGPNPIDPEILKPDITAPGVNILAAYTGAVAPTPLPEDTRIVKFSVLSGTSMSCPHISGIVGLLKSLHPQWSPAAIRSAIMTTATTRDNNKKPISGSVPLPPTPLNYGAGHVNPNKAADPGLVYDLAEDDYLNFLCAKGYSDEDLKAVALKPYKCPKSASILNLNYPSIAVPRLNGSAITITREVKNVGTPGTYTVKVEAPAGVSIKVKPVSLKFGKVGEVKKFSVTLKAVGKSPSVFAVFGSFVWSDGKHQVRSPIAVGA
uniref:Uncharacterized protein n=1 Tax=Kalanchoe fedtschenkoi TaxID=63787 RepID=A0A7N0VKZ9_KALFE